MSGSRSFVRPLLSVLLIALTMLGLMNVYADNSEEQLRAEEVACGQKVCDTHLVQLSRSVIAQTFTFQTRPRDGKGQPATVTVECARQFIFAGDYRCVPQ